MKRGDTEINTAAAPEFISFIFDNHKKALIFPQLMLT